MTITLRPEQEQVIQDAIDSGLVRTADEALDEAIAGLRCRPPKAPSQAESTATVVRRLR